MGVWQCPSRYHPMWDRPRVSRTVMELLARSAVRVEELITQTFPYDRAPEAHRFIDEHPEETIKAVLSYE
jgi:threonine dehydrogenase-like Zn-dependent dehydrogenase